MLRRHPRAPTSTFARSKGALAAAGRAALVLVALASAQAPAPPPAKAQAAAPVDFVARWLARGRAALAAKQPAEAREAFERVLERPSDHLGALAALAALERDEKRLDRALWYADRFLERWRHTKPPPAELSSARAELHKLTRESDPLRPRLDTLRREYVSRLLQLAGERMDQLAWHSARAILREAVATDPEHPELAAGLARIEKEGGNELAVADESGGVDPLAGVTAEWVAENDPLHADWDKAWELSTEHYRIKTNAGYRVLRTVANAMEQVQVFYRIFHQYKTKGEKIPPADVWMFKDRDEYTRIGKPPVDWSAGYWNGSQVVTYDHRGGGEGSLRDTLETLFHEASHQFTTLAGGSGVPAWLNEGMASFFEGTVLLSNGKLDWNLVVPGRLYPLVDDLRKPDRHRLGDVIQGNVDDYRVYYPWGWGIVYYLYNAEDVSGRLLYRSLMREYFQEYATEKHLERFTEFFVTRAKVPGITTLAEFEAAFIAYALELEQLDKGTLDAARRYEERGDRQMALEDPLRAVELYSRSLERDPDHPEVLWKLAAALEQARQGDRAAGVLRQWLSVTAPDSPEAAEAQMLSSTEPAAAPASAAPPAGAASGSASDDAATRRKQALARIQRLDTSARRLAELRTKFHGDARALADEYDAKGFGHMAALVLRGPATSVPADTLAVKRYFEICDKYGVSLERWRLIFDESSLRGFYGEASEFTVKDGAIVANIADGAPAPAPSTGSGAPQPAAAKADKSFAFRRLFVDERPSGDWSLSAEIRLEPGARMAGLCFGKKQDGDFHGLVFLPEGYVDLARFGVDGKPLVRTRVQVTPSEWHVLRLDVAGTRLVGSLDGEEAVDHVFGSRGELRGDFGLLAGTGTSRFREIKLLDYDPNLPRRTKVGHRAPATDVAAEKLARAAPGQSAYVNQFPPLLRVERWIGTPPEDGDLDRLRHWPVILCFWTTYSERAVPQLPGLIALRERYAKLDIPILLISDDKPEDLETYLAVDPVPFPIGLNHVHAAFDDYGIPKLRLPHAKLLDPSGKVVWEGNPEYSAEFGTFLDEPLAALVEKHALEKLADAARALASAQEAYGANEFAKAHELAAPVAALALEHPRVNAARSLLEALEREGAQRMAQAEALAGSGRLLESVRALDALARDFGKCKVAGEAKAASEKRAKTKPYQAAKSLEGKLRQVATYLRNDKLEPAKKALAELRAKLDAPASAPSGAAAPDPWLRERADWLAAEIDFARDGKSLFEKYGARFGPAE